MAAITASTTPREGANFSGEPAPRCPHALETHPTTDAASEMTIAGTPEAAAEKVNKVSPEGRPALIDAKSGPRRIAGEMLIAAAVVLLGSVGIGLYFGLGAGLASLGIALVALAFNPVLGASALRIRDRSEVIHTDGEHNL